MLKIKVSAGTLTTMPIVEVRRRTENILCDKSSEVRGFDV
jgi:hypothetical protein